ncbi:pathogenesis-related protein 1-like [Canna indica]|uniref:Pathogenesis-related protein 1-like n=1 Tax=Canna indica TaxID=4628 RepID=A0AAQ3KHK4_9LILI|nr:pathogenesis-related protein 1-like [Canna indica]
MASSSSFLVSTIFFCFITSLASAQNLTTNAKVTPAVAISQFVASHNAARRLVGVPPLEWDAKLARFAKAYAGQRRGDCRLVHSPGYAYGENIFWGQGRRWSVPDAVAKWVKEKQWYHYDKNSCDAGADCTHYTQIVWRTTQKLGCAKIICNSGDTFIVCEYYPPGNYVGARPY